MVVRDLDMHNSCNFGGELKGPLVRDLERGVEVHNPVLLHVLVEADPQDKPVDDAQYSSNRVQQQAAFFAKDRLLKTGSELRHIRPTAHARIATLPGRKCRPDQQSGG
ncbi:hypothetical protein quinque_009303 [Culex quinquefasciatus]